MRTRRWLTVALFAALTLALTGCPAIAADNDERKYVGEFGIFVGMSVADEDLVGDGDGSDTSPLFGLRWAARISPKWNWFADGDYMRHDTVFEDDSKVIEGRIGFERLFPFGNRGVNWFLAGAVGATDVNYPTGGDDFSRPLLSLGLGLAKDRGGIRAEVRAEQLLGDEGIGGADVTNFQALVGYAFPLYERPEQSATRKPMFEEERTTLVLQGVNFEYDSARLTQESHEVLDRVARSLREWPEVRVEVGGYTDDVGTDEYNMELSERRAQAVRDYLMAKGVGGSRLEAKGYGKTRPLNTNNTEEARAQNRRVELKRR
jgi:outer membrane protein OmpA-like peptidoglycan-associated protein